MLAKAKQVTVKEKHLIEEWYSRGSVDEVITTLHQRVSLTGIFRLYDAQNMLD